MANHTLYKAICVTALIVITACSRQSISNPAQYLSYLANPKNGLVKEKDVAGIHYKIKYLPPDYLVYNMAKNTEKIDDKLKDSLLTAYNNSLSFMVTIGPAVGEDFDITRLGVSNYNEFAQRIEDMAFGAQEWIGLEIDSIVQRPVIVRMENINALEKSRNFIAVFPKSVIKNKAGKNDLCFVYSDELFNTGTNKFVFKTADIEELPVFKF